ncbi:hypothetical protein EI42_06043 [Thermosporothrix hazakensis]|jgi:hypothetical protein|uniref:Uncharacterized protein n=1 Tax=Thermosporothrix hazakensis TaxID=644383 RepID=A0A326TSN7_THEHA|nr:hypothetical protein EI42_06043 [Thermosporothrix hazakensis]
MERIALLYIILYRCQSVPSLTIGLYTRWNCVLLVTRVSPANSSARISQLLKYSPRHLRLPVGASR